MKKILLLILPLLAMSVSSCNHLEKPRDTNLNYWLGEKVSFDDSRQYLDSNIYLDGDYRFIINEQGEQEFPQTYVSYQIENGVIDTIEIKDPEIVLYNFCLNSSPMKVSIMLDNFGFKGGGIYDYTGNNGYLSIYFKKGKTIIVQRIYEN